MASSGFASGTLYGERAIARMRSRHIPRQHGRQRHGQVRVLPKGTVKLDVLDPVAAVQTIVTKVIRILRGGGLIDAGADVAEACIDIHIITRAHSRRTGLAWTH